MGWAEEAAGRLVAERAAEPTTPLLRVDLSWADGLSLHVKDESRRPSGGVKHGHARDLLLDALRRGASGCADYATGMPSRIPGIGRPRMEPAFDPGAVDLVVPVPDAASVAAMRHLEAFAGLAAGPSTGACLWAACHLVDRLRGQGARGSVVVLAGDAAGPYRSTHYDDAWTAAQGWHLDAPLRTLREFTAGGRWPEMTAN